MTRPYYTDPLAAAWMAKHFGMKFDGDPFPVTFSFRHSDTHGPVRLHVHPGSAHLLEPKNGDKVAYSFGVGPHAGEAWDEVKGVVPPGDEGYPYTGNGEPYVLVDGCDEFPLSRLKRIFERGGKAFFWPETEANG